MDTPMPNSIPDGSSEYPLLRSLSIPPLNSSKELLTLGNDTIIDIYTLILTVMSTDFVNTHYQTLRSEYYVKQASGLFLGDRESMLKVGLYGFQVLGRKRKYITNKGSSLNIYIVLSISITSNLQICYLQASVVAAGYKER